MDSAATSLLFPTRLIGSLADARGPAWERLVKRLAQGSSGSPASLAFVLMVARLSGCANCTADSYRAAQGCALCAGQALKRFHGSDQELVKLYDSTQAEVQQRYPGTRTRRLHSDTNST